MSIFKASDAALKASQKAFEARRAAEKCQSAKAMRLITEAENLSKQADALAASHRYTTREGISIRFQVETSILLRGYQRDAFFDLLAAKSALGECVALETGVKFGDFANDAAEAGDPERARRLREAARSFLDTVDQRFLLRIRRRAIAKDFRRLGRQLRDLNDTLKDAAKKKPIYPFRNGGTFEGTVAGKKGQAQTSPAGSKNRIEFMFRPTAREKCKSVCLVSVFHSEDTSKCGAVVEDPIEEAVKSNPFAALTLPASADIKDGYLVDTFRDALCPCFPNDNQVKKALPALPGQGGGPVKGIFGFDEPVEANPDIESYFETAAMCFDRKPFTVLQTMRWKSAVENGVQTTTVLPNGAKIDWGAPSRPFQKALRKWFERDIGDEKRRGCAEGYLKESQ